MNVFTEGFQVLAANPEILLVLTFGVFFGIVFGCIPGLTATLGVVLLIPITYSMAPAMGLSLLIGVYIGGISGGLITAILLNIPGTPSSIFTCWDGYPMAKNGHPGRALSIGVFSSLLGGCFSAVALMAIAPQLASVSLQFGNWELFGLILMAMCIIAVMTEGDPVKSTLSLLLGLLLATVGLDSLTGLDRLTFGAWQLSAGFASTSVMMGIFAISEIMQQVREIQANAQIKLDRSMTKVPFIPDLKALKGCWRTMGIGSVIGTFIGILPAIGQQTAALITYNQAKSLSKEPEKFGTGYAEGIVASEVSNNAVCGGALIPLITLGIPGDMTTAALIGGLMIHGLQPGPLLFKTNPETVGVIMLVYLISNVVMYFMEIGLMGVFVKMLNIPKAFLFPFIILCCIMGVFALNNRVFDIWVLVIFGFIGYLLSACQVPATPIIMGYLMGKTFETNLRRALISSNGNFFEIFSRPIATGFLAVSVLFVIVPIGFRLYKRSKAMHTAA